MSDTTVVSDIGPLSYLFRLGRLELLRTLYGRVVAPPAVVAEINRGVRLGRSLPDVGSIEWIEIESPASGYLGGIEGLGPGETEVIALGRSRTDGLLLIDDGLARQVASSLGLRVSGTVGVLILGKQRGLVERVAPEIDRLSTFGFRLSSRAREHALAIAGELG